MGVSRPLLYPTSLLTAWRGHSPPRTPVSDASRLQPRPPPPTQRPPAAAAANAQRARCDCAAEPAGPHRHLLVVGERDGWRYCSWITSTYCGVASRFGRWRDTTRLCSYVHRVHQLLRQLEPERTDALLHRDEAAMEPQCSREHGRAAAQRSQIPGTPDYTASSPSLPLATPPPASPSPSP